jgi:hypothetical protein
MVTCKEKVKKEWLDTRKDLKKFFDKDDYKGLSEYGLSIDKVEAGTFEGQKKSYIRYQFSWGGPSDELRIFRSGKIEYWFMDWFDGAMIDVTKDIIAQKATQYAKGILNEK